MPPPSTNETDFQNGSSFFPQMSGELRNLEQQAQLCPLRQPVYLQDACLSEALGDLSLGSCQAKVFNLAKSPRLTNCHVRKEEHGTVVTVNMKPGERQK